MEYFKFLFLDVDGVLNNMSDHTMMSAEDNLSDKNLQWLKWLKDKNPELKVVLSSSWRHDLIVNKQFDTAKIKYISPSTQYLKVKLAECGIEIYDITESYHNFCSAMGIEGYTRHLEIFNYVLNNLTPNNTFAILDDEKIDPTGMFIDHFVRTDATYGLTDWDASAVNEILNSRPEFKPFGSV